MTEKNETLRGGLDEISVEKKAKKGSMRSIRNDKESIIRDLWCKEMEQIKVCVSKIITDEKDVEYRMRNQKALSQYQSEKE